MNKTTIANRLTLLSIWIAPLPVFFILSDESGHDIVAAYQKFHSDLPTGSAFLVHHLSFTNLAVLTLLVSVGMLVGQRRVRTEQNRFIFQIVFILVWQLATLGILYGRALPYFFKVIEIHR